MLQNTFRIYSFSSSNVLQRLLCGFWPKKLRLVGDDVFILVPAVDFSREEFAQTLAVVGSIRGRAPVVADEKHIACVEVGACMDISLYSSTPNFASKGTN